MLKPLVMCASGTMKVADVTFPLRAMSAALCSFWSRGKAVERTGYLVGALLVVSGLVHFAILNITGASSAGPLSLRKPTTFGVSFGLT